MQPVFTNHFQSLRNISLQKAGLNKLSTVGTFLFRLIFLFPFLIELLSAVVFLEPRLVIFKCNTIGWDCLQYKFWGHSIIMFALRGRGVMKKANKGGQWEEAVVRSERSHFKRFQRRVIPAIT